jgi:hypothetical protein
MKLVEHFQYGLNSPICLTWELTYALQPGVCALPVVVRSQGSA